MRGREISDDRPMSIGTISQSRPIEDRDESMTESMDMPESRGEDMAIDVDAPSNYVREVNIKPLDSGYLVKVGCQSVAVETTETLIKALNDYLTNPDAFERAWFKNKNRNKLQ